MSKRALLLGGTVAGLAFLGGWAMAQTGVGPGHMMGMRGQMGPMHSNGRADEHGPGPRMGPRMGMNGMPMMGMMGMGMHGGYATPSEHADIRDLFMDHEKISRTVTNLPNGIRTLTESDDPQMARTIKSHVQDMGARVEQGRDPGLPIETDALHAIFRQKDKIASTYELTEKGIAVVQTSSDPQVVKDLQKHAAEVLLASVMVLLVGVLDVRGPINLFICLTCLTLLFFESAFGICIGCKLYELVWAKPQLCPGGACEVGPKLPMQKVGAAQTVALAAYLLFVTGLSVQVSTKASGQQTATPAAAGDEGRCTVPAFAVAIGHVETWKLHNNCK